MPDWTTITNALVAVGAKPFATTIQALRDNPVAIAEGQPGAPKIVGQALRTHRGPLAFISTGSVGPDGWTDLGRVEWMRFDLVLTGPTTSGTTRVDWRFSVDGGATWSAYVTNGPSAGVGATVSGAFWINLVTGQWYFLGGATQRSGTTAPPSGAVNGLQFRLTTGSGGAQILNLFGHIVSGVAP